MSGPAFARATLGWLDRGTMSVAARIVAAGERTVDFVRRRPIETGIVLVAMAIRFSMLLTFHPNNGYDAYDHYAYIQWFATHWSLPDLMLSRTTYHPPFYYWVLGFVARVAPGKPVVLELPSIMFACATLLLTWYGMERFLPGRRLARIAGLALAAVLPSGVHLAGMVSNEALNGLLATAALLVAAEALARQQRGESILGRAVLIGVLLGLEMLTKISALATLGAIGLGAGLALILGGGSLALRARRAAPWLLVVVAFVATSGWYFARNQRLHGKAVLSGYDGLERTSTRKIDTPYLQRRPAEFFYGWSNDVLSHPYAPSGETPKSYFWPVVVASTFSDYYNYGFVRGPTTPTATTGNWKALREAAATLSSVSAVGGTAIALSTAIAWVWAFVVCVRRRQLAALVLLLGPAVDILGQLHFVVKYPYDYEGPIKGAYMQFAAAPLFALFGLAVDKMAQRRWTVPIAVVQGLAVVGVASYTIYARVFAL